MTEDDWISATEPGPLLESLGPLSPRKTRLFVVACCRRVDRFLDRELRDALDGAEAFADGALNGWTLEGLRRRLQEAIRWRWGPRPASLVREAVFRALDPGLDGFEARVVADRLATAALCMGRRNLESVFQSDLVRDLWANPYRPPVHADPAWRTANGGAALRLARVLYDERSFDDLPVLGDALEEAGCTDADVLSHCREPGEHVRGCWVVDLVLGKD
jgi:hypothetical protein